MTLPPSPYELLGISSAASPQAVKRAYRQQAYLHHPDRLQQQQTDDYFKQITAAYQLLKNEHTRTIVDWFGSATPTPAQMQATLERHLQQGMHKMWQQVQQRLPVTRMLAGMAQKVLPSLHEQRWLEAPLALAITGGVFQFTWLQYICCATCRGIGLIRQIDSKPCRPCRGRGQIALRELLQNKRMLCLHCHGVGQTPTQTCAPCHGIGTLSKTSSQRITLAQLTLEGPHSTLSKLGHQRDWGLPAGDVQLCLRYELPPGYWREGNKLYKQLRIPAQVAHKGGAVRCPWLNGELLITIPAKSQAGMILKLRGMGLPYQHPEHSQRKVMRGEGRLLLQIDPEQLNQ